MSGREQEPGPRGSPQVPHPAGAREADAAFADTAKTDNCWVNLAP
jgi:hypothetical protein